MKGFWQPKIEQSLGEYKASGKATAIDLARQVCRNGGSIFPLGSK